MTRLRTLYRRVTATTRVVPLLAIVATFAALVAFVVQHPTAAVWAVVVALFLALAGLATLVGEIDAETRRADAAAARAETFADELIDERKRSRDAEKAVVRLVGEKLRLQNELMRAQMTASDAENEAADDDADVIPLPVREASPYDWPQNADDAAWQALYDQNGDPR